MDAFERALDLILAGLGLVLLSPLLAAITALVWLQDGRPVFYRAWRTGRDGRPFGLYKFRTMAAGADRVGPGITLRDDPRVTPLGRRLRRAKLDELPQLLNVVRGEMSLVGPRPEDPRYVALYTPEQRRVLRARPGITSPASLEYRDESRWLSHADWETTYRETIMPRKLAIELDYLARRTVLTDLWLILRTAACVFEPLFRAK